MAVLHSRQRDDVLVVYFTDAKLLDFERITQIGAELIELAKTVAESGSKKMLVNFQGVQFMSSAMIGKLVLLKKICKRDGVALKFCSLSPNVLEVFKIVGLRFPGMDDDDGPESLGIGAKIPKGPKSDGGHAHPPRARG